MRSTYKIATLSLLILTASISVAGAQDLVHWAPNLEAAKQMASKQNKLVLVHFWGDNCPPCRALEANVFTDAEFASSVDRNYVPVKINAQRMPATARQFGVDRWPQDVIITPSGQRVFQTVSPSQIGQYTSMLTQISAKVKTRKQELAANAPPANVGPTANTPGNATQSRFSSPRTTLASNQQQPNAPAFNQQPQPAVNNTPVIPNGIRSNDPIVRAQVASAPVANTGNRFSAQPVIGPAAPVTQSSTPIAKALPPNVALEGFCCVTLAEKTAWTQGDARWGAVHLGKVYLFATEADQKTFLSDPNKYSPVLSGNDPVAFAQSGKLVAGNRRHGLAYLGSLYLFSSQASLEQFIAEPTKYHAVVAQAMQQVNSVR
ncbi:MAG: DUF255 domain-containing protein [Pirellulales bacterium]